MLEKDQTAESSNLTDNVVKNIAGVLKNSGESSETSFRVCDNNLPAKPSAWTKIKNALCYEIKVELTPYQQKVEDEINEFLHKEITWQSFKAFWLQEVKITL